MKSLLDDLDELLVSMGKYPDTEEVMKVLRALLRAKPELKRDIAVKLYEKKAVSLSKAAEIYGSNMEDLKKLLKEREVKIEAPYIPVEEIDEEVENIFSGNL